MKNLKRCCLALIMALIVPLGLILTACGATATNEVRGVFFESTLYDEETGHAVFEVDEKISTDLTFKVTPSSWSGYKPVYQVLRSGNSNDNLQNFDLQDGKIYVKNSRFEPITVQISVNDYTDTCIIRLKEYPTDIFFVDSEGNRVSEYDEVITANSNYNIHVYGMFAGETEPKELKDDAFKFSVKSSDETVIEVKNKNRLTLSTLKSKMEKSTVTVSLLNVAGESKFESDSLKKYETKELKINFTVMPPVKSGYIKIDGYDHFISKDITEAIEINASSLNMEQYNGSDTYYISYEATLISTTNMLITKEMGGYTIEVSSSDENHVEVSEAESKIYIVSGSNISFTLTFMANYVTETGKPFMVSVNIDFKI